MTVQWSPFNLEMSEEVEEKGGEREGGKREEGGRREGRGRENPVLSSVLKRNIPNNDPRLKRAACHQRYETLELENNSTTCGQRRPKSGTDFIPTPWGVWRHSNKRNPIPSQRPLLSASCGPYGPFGDFMVSPASPVLHFPAVCLHITSQNLWLFVHY